ncbi:MAG: helix-turn-helix transcriptional regulator, partial [Mailhella sp.]
MKNVEQQYFRASECARYLGIHRSTFYRKVAEGDIPEGIKMSERITLWDKKILDNYMAQKPSSS